MNNSIEMFNPVSEPHLPLEQWVDKENKGTDFARFFKKVLHSQQDDNLEFCANLKKIAEKYNENDLAMVYAWLALLTCVDDGGLNPQQHQEAVKKVVTYTQRIMSEMDQDNPNFMSILKDMSKDYADHQKSERNKNSVLIIAGVIALIGLLMVTCIGPIISTLIIVGAVIIICSALMGYGAAAYHIAKPNYGYHFFSESKKLLESPYPQAPGDDAEATVDNQDEASYARS